MLHHVTACQTYDLGNSIVFIHVYVSEEYITWYDRLLNVNCMSQICLCINRVVESVCHGPYNQRSTGHYSTTIPHRTHNRIIT